MKRYIILTSILALTACGGGSGGSGIGGTGGGSMPTTTTPRPTTVTDAAAQSNANITAMDSEILVADDGSLYTLAGSGIRSGSRPTVTYNGKTYTSYNLSDVKLFAADTTGTVGDVKPNLIMGLDDDGRINKITLTVGGVESEIARDTETTFHGPIFEYVPDGDDEAIFRIADTGQDMDALNELASINSLSGGHWNRVDERMDVQTNGGDVGLQYSDFGHFNPVYRSKNRVLTEDALADIRAYYAALANGETPTQLNRPGDLDTYRDDDEFAAELAKEDYQLMAGGYAIKDGQVLDTLPTPTSTTFSGRAIGRVYASIGSNDSTVLDTTRAAILEKYGYQNDDADLPFYYQTTDSTAANYVMDAGHDEAKAFTTDAATLTIDADGNQTLVMPFQDFYTVTASLEAGATTPTIGFEIPSGGSVATPYKREVDSTNTYAGTTGTPTQSFNPGYYGVNTATEAAGTVFHKEKTTGMDVTVGDDTNTFKRDWEFQGAYGMKKDN